MRQVGQTSGGNILVEMTSLEWDRIHTSLLQPDEIDSIEWQVKHAWHQGKLDEQLANRLIRACEPGGLLNKVPFADFLAMVRSGKITQIPYVGRGRARILYEVFVDQQEIFQESGQPKC